MTVTSTRLFASQCDGYPMVLSRGAVLLWRDPTTRVWSIILRSAQEMEPNPHRVRGRIASPGLADVAPLPHRAGALVRSVADGVEFDIANDPVLAMDEGITFRLDPTACVGVILRMDDRADPSAVFVGASEMHPSTVDLVICP